MSLLRLYAIIGDQTNDFCTKQIQTSVNPFDLIFVKNDTVQTFKIGKLEAIDTIEKHQNSGYPY